LGFFILAAPLGLESRPLLEALAALGLWATAVRIMSVMTPCMVVGPQLVL
jgi:hypothetical protein